MIAGDNPDLPEVIDASTLKVHAPTLVVFVCGGATGSVAAPPKSVRDAFMRIAHLTPLAKYKLILAEDVEVFLPIGEYRELLRFESDIAQIAELLLLFSESAGSLAELGAFVMDDEVAPRMMVVIDDENYKNDSFIKLGPLYTLQLHHGDASVCVLVLTDLKMTSIGDVAKIDSDKLSDAMKDALTARLAIKRDPSTFNSNKNGHVTKLITGLIQHYAALTVTEIDTLLFCLGVPTPIENIKKHLLCAEIFGWVIVEKRGIETYYVDVSSRAAAINYDFAPGRPKLDRIRWRADILEHWRKTDPQRFKSITTAKSKK